MASSKKPKKRVLKKSETVRERVSKAAQAPKPKRIHRARSVAAKPIKSFWTLLSRLLRPLRFLLWPFKTKPVRFVGRILSRVLLLKYFRESWQEMREVVWPTRRQTMQLTLAVFLFALFFGAIIAAADYGLDKLFKALILE